MIIELIIALLLGCIIGTFTGLAPGIHINLVATMLLSSISYFSGVPVLALVVFITAMSITHTFIDFIPSVFLGAPNEDSFLAVLPGHKLLKEGKGYEAAVLTLAGSLAALPAILLLAVVFIYELPSFYSLIKTLIPFILIFVSFYMILREQNPYPALIIFVLSGILGFAAFNHPIKEPLMPLLTGLFGLSSLIVSVSSDSRIKKQEIPSLKSIFPSGKEFISSALASYIAAPLCSFLPGIGSGHAAVIGSEMIKQTPRKFLFLVGSVSTIVMGLSFVTLFAIGKTRTGSAAAVQQLLRSLSLSELIVILLAIILSGVLAFFVGMKLSKFFSANITKISYKTLGIVISAFLVIVNFFFTNFLGLIVLITSSFLGIYCILSGSKRINMMGSLIIPSVLYYLI